MKFTLNLLANLVLTVLFFSSVNVLSAEKVKASGKLDSFNLKVVYGDKTSEFILIGVSTDKKAKAEKGGVLKFSSNGQTKQRDVAEKDLKFLFAEIKKIRGSNQKHLCDDRGYIEIVNGVNKSVGCLGSKTKVAKQLTSMANLLTAMVK